jgi:serine/threonine-protein kinase
MATVYLATTGSRLGARRWCALKVLHDKLSDQEQYSSMFFNEARIASEIAHPHVCNVFDYGSSNGQAYLAMDFLQGKSLANVAQACAGEDDLALHAARVARILADICEGLSAIHEYETSGEGPLRVVHRDISPDNLILGFDGFVKVIDFGLAKVPCRGEKTQSGILKGKISYIAPELLTGAPASASADLWSLGVVAWELLTGQRLFRRATDAGTLRSLVEHPVDPPSQLRPGLPPALDAIVLRALERDPTERYASARDFGAALWAFLGAQPKLIQHHDLRDWLSRLFPGERERLLSQLESPPALAPPDSAIHRARRSVRLRSGLLGRVSSALPTRHRRRAMVTALVLAGAVGLGLFRWGSGRTATLSAGAIPNANALPAGMAFRGQPLRFRDDKAALVSSAGFVVEVKRSPDASEVIVHVRPSPPAAQLSAAP